MPDEKIFIVEDERIVAEDLKRMIERLGYKVVGSAVNGADAIRQVEASRPDLVLMDIRIQGAMDGIEVAEHIYTHFDIPVSYLTAYADETTLDRAKATMPFGYILKPFEERNLKTTIELALYRHQMDSMLKGLENWHASALQDLSEAVIAADTQGRVMFINKAAETLMGRSLDQLYGKFLDQFVTFRGNGGAESEALVERAGRQIILRATCTTIKASNGRATGSAWVFKEASPSVSLSM